MNAAQLLGLGLNVSIMLTVFALALGAGPGRIRGTFAPRWLLARAFVAMFVVMPLVAVLIAKYLHLNHALLVALLLLALSPVPPVLPNKQIKAGGGEEFVLALLVLSALAAILVVPAGLAIIGILFDRDLDVPFGVVGRVVGSSVLLPVVLGLVVARYAPAFAARAKGPVGKFSGILLLVSFLPLVWGSWEALAAQMNNYTVVAMAAFIGIGLLAGHLSGGPVRGDRTALALASATRHPGVAIAVISAYEPQNTDVAPVVILYLLVSMIVTIPYVRWCARGRGAEA